MEGGKRKELQKMCGFWEALRCGRLGFFLQVTFPPKAERNHGFVICSYRSVNGTHTHLHTCMHRYMQAHTGCTHTQMRLSRTEQSILQHDYCDG